MKHFSKSHINQLKKIRYQLQLRQTMSYKQWILGEKNQNIIDEATIFIDRAIDKLKDVQS